MDRDTLKKKINKLLDVTEEKDANAMQERQLRAEILENIPPHGLSVERGKVKRRGSRSRDIKSWKKLEKVLRQDYGFTAEELEKLMNLSREKVHSDPTLILTLKPTQKNAAKPKATMATKSAKTVCAPQAPESPIIDLIQGILKLIAQKAPAVERTVDQKKYIETTNSEALCKEIHSALVGQPTVLIQRNKTLAPLDDLLRALGGKVYSIGSKGLTTPSQQEQPLPAKASCLPAFEIIVVEAVKQETKHGGVLIADKRLTKLIKGAYKKSKTKHGGPPLTLAVSAPECEMLDAAKTYEEFIWATCILKQKAKWINRSQNNSKGGAFYKIYQSIV